MQDDVNERQTQIFKAHMQTTNFVDPSSSLFLQNGNFTHTPSAKLFGRAGTAGLCSSATFLSMSVTTPRQGLAPVDHCPCSSCSTSSGAENPPSYHMHTAYPNQILSFECITAIYCDCMAKCRLASSHIVSYC